jgi:hypothetical protein
LSTYKRYFLSLTLSFFLLLMFVAAPFLNTTRAQQTGNQPLVARITVQNKEEFQRLVNLGLDILEMREGNSYFFLTTPEQLEKLRTEGWEVKPDETQTALLKTQQETQTFSGGYRTVAEMRSLLQSKQTMFPNLAEYFVYGQSWEKINSGGTGGNDLFGIKLTNKSRTGPKPTFFLMAAIHARELTTSELALRLVDYLLNNYGTDGDVTWLLDEHLIVIVPSVNPDGRIIAQQGFFQRKNTNTTYGGNCANPPTSSNQFGVDLNRNSHFKWGTVNSPSEPRCGQTYPGPSVASEPETQAMENLVLSLFPDQRGPNDTDPAPTTTTGTMLTLHSYSNLVLWPWGWGEVPAPNANELSIIGQKYAAYNGFTPQQSIELYATSGTTDDWAYGELGICSMTFEVGPSSGSCGGFFPPFSCLDGGTGGNFWQRNLPAFLYAARIARAPYQLGQGPTTESLSTLNATSTSFELRAQLSDQFNGNQNISAAEYYIDTPPWRGGTAIPMTALDGSFNSNVEIATATVNSSGQHLFYVRGRDANGNWGPVRGIFSPTVCSYNITPGNQPFPINGGINTVAVTSATGCAWTATSNAAWINITSGASGSGNGTVGYSVTANSGAVRTGTMTIAGQTFTVTQSGEATPFSLDGDAKSDMAIWRPSAGVWHIINSSNSSITSVGWGVQDDLIMPGDYDGDGKADITIWRPSTGVWFIRNSSNGSIRTQGWGINTDAPVPADYDGDGKTDVAVWRGSTGTWFIVNSSNNSVTTPALGASGDVPVPGDYDGDGKADLAVRNPLTGIWQIRNSSNGSLTTIGWGTQNDLIVPGDYDSDGKADLAVWRPTSGVWFIHNSSNGTTTTVGWGVSTDVPVPADYDGDGKTDIAIWRPASGVWFIRNSSNGSVSSPTWGIVGDIPVPSAFVR